MPNRFPLVLRAVGASVACAVALSVTGCGGEEQPFGRPAVDADLRGRSYVAVEAEEHEFAEGREVSVGFAGKTVGTYGGCNGTNGSRYAMKAGRLEVSDEASSTLVGCRADYEAQDDWIFRFLVGHPKALVQDDGERLELSTADETVTFEARARPEGRRVVPQETIDRYIRDVRRWSAELQVEKDKLRDQVKKGNVTAAEGKARKKRLQAAHDRKLKAADPFDTGP